MRADACLQASQRVRAMRVCGGQRARANAGVCKYGLQERADGDVACAALRDGVWGEAGAKG
eukprot:3683328-Pleurochrysis_carterae.AAC.1